MLFGRRRADDASARSVGAGSAHAADASTRSDRCVFENHGRGVTFISLCGRRRSARIVRRLRGAARESRFTTFSRVATGVAVHSEADPENALRTAATAVARTVTDLNDLFLDGAFAASVAEILGNASAHTGSDVVELDCSVNVDEVRSEACDWTRDAVRQARERASEVLRPERVSDTQQLVHLRNALKKACDEDLGNEWRSACASLFVVEGSTDASGSDWRLARSRAECARTCSTTASTTSSRSLGGRRRR